MLPQNTRDGSNLGNVRTRDRACGAERLEVVEEIVVDPHHDLPAERAL